MAGTNPVAACSAIPNSGVGRNLVRNGRTSGAVTIVECTEYRNITRTNHRLQRVLDIQYKVDSERVRSEMRLS